MLYVKINFALQNESGGSKMKNARPDRWADSHAGRLPGRPAGWLAVPGYIYKIHNKSPQLRSVNASRKNQLCLAKRVGRLKNEECAS